MTVLGGFIIAFSFFSLNLVAHRRFAETDDAAVFGLIVVNCMLAAASGSITAITYERHRESKESRQWRVSTAINGSLVGLVRCIKRITYLTIYI